MTKVGRFILGFLALPALTGTLVLAGEIGVYEEVGYTIMAILICSAFGAVTALSWKDE